MNPAVQDWNDPAAVADWIAHRSCSNPGRHEQLAMVVTLLGQLQPAGLRILDLGCGDGVVAEMLLTRLPDSYVTGIDLSPPMLAAAETRLQAYPGRYALYRRSLADWAPLSAEPAPFDAAIAVQSVHHLDGAEKQALFAWVAAHLRPGGLFVLSDRVNLSSAALFAYHEALYVAAHGQQAGALPAGYRYAAHRQALALRADQPDIVADQLLWLRAAGFGEADCFHRFVERAIFGGLKLPPGSPNQPDPADRSAVLVDASNAAGGLL